VSTIAPRYSRLRHRLHEAAKFLVIGGAGTLVTFGLASVLHPIGKYVAITIATVAATLVNYAGNKHWTFRHRTGTGTARDGILFIAGNVAGLLIYFGCIGLAGLTGDAHDFARYIAALVVGTVVGSVFRFWAYRQWIWHKAPSHHQLSPRKRRAPALAGASAAESLGEAA
jgi:putative flippase GtrA